MSFQVQNQIRQNASDIRTYIDDLYSWEEQVNTKDNSKSQQKPKKEYAIRGNVVEDKQTTARQTQNTGDESQQNPALIRDKNTIPDYYKAWDQIKIVKIICFRLI
jgi:hypothetical protein